MKDRKQKTENRKPIRTVFHFRFPVFGLLFPVSFLSGSGCSGLGPKRAVTKHSQRRDGQAQSRRRQPHCWLLLLLALATVLAACTRLPARSAACLLRIGTSGDYPPFSEVITGGGYEGLDVDVARRLAADLGCDVRFVPFRWPELLARLGSGDLDLVMSGVTMRSERAVAGRYTRPYAFTGAVAVLRPDSLMSPAGVDDLNRPGIRIAVNRGGHLERVAREHFPRSVLRTVEDNRALAQQLMTGLADAVVSDSAEVHAWDRADLRVIGPFTHDAKAFLLPAAEAERARRIDEWLVAREADGWLPRARARWLGSDSALDAAAVTSNAVAAMIQLRLGLMPAVGAAKRAAGLPVADPAQEARVLGRVRAMATRQPERTVAVYRELIEMAKVQQRNPSDEPAATLPALRDAIARIDEQLVREIERVPARSRSEWLEVLTAFVTAPGIDEGMRTRLTVLLGGGA
jgi:cyclohexadienyl dehydratase